VHRPGKTIAFAMALAGCGIGASSGLGPRAAACDVLDGSIKTQMQVAQARDYHAIFPRMGYSPELESSHPAFFVVYEGTVRMPVMGAPGVASDGGAGAGVRTESVTGVVCVVVDGQRIVKSEVDTSR